MVFVSLSFYKGSSIMMSLSLISNINIFSKIPNIYANNEIIFKKFISNLSPKIWNIIIFINGPNELLNNDTQKLYVLFKPLYSK